MYMLFLFDGLALTLFEHL